MGVVNSLPGTELASAPGAQLQGINVQGVDIQKSFVGVSIDWVDPVTKLYFDPINTTTNVTFNSNPYTVQKVMTPLSRKDDSVGVWGYEFLTNGMDPGDYIFTFTGQVPGSLMTVTHVLPFTVAETPIEQYFVGALRAKLWDRRASRYIVDDSTRTRWSNAELFGFIDNARLKIGQTPPNPQLITFEYAYAQTHDLMLTGGFIEALEAAGIFETFQKFNYVDELTLNIDRSVFFQNAQSLRQQWMTSVMAWKRSMLFSAMSGGVGMASGRYPLYYTKILSLSVANGQNMFFG